MRILITGATGFIGKEVGKALVNRGHQIIVISRNLKKAKQELPFPCEVIEGDLQRDAVRDERIKTISGVIHLLGENIGNSRWTDSKRQQIYDSRVKGSQNLLLSLQGVVRPEFILSTSAIGYYGNRGDEELTEDSHRGQGFLSDVCQDWEKPFHLAEAKDLFPNTRYITLRLGMVLGSYGGATQKMMTPFRLGLGGEFGSGQQWMSWIHLHDLIKLIVCMTEISDFKGIYNGVAPQPVTNSVFTKTFAEAFQKRTFFPVPDWILKVGLGQMSSLILDSQKVFSIRLKSTSFQFQYPRLKDAIEDIVRPYIQGEHIFYAEQFLPKKKEEVFPFFAEATNLEKLTPEILEFQILKMSTPKIQKGTLIDYKLRLHGIPLKWRTKIEDWNPCEYFSDSQEVGPYSFWHHEHIFENMKNGTLMVDRIRYKLPFGILGWLVAGAYVRKDLRNIFQFRREIISQEKGFQE